MTNSTNIRFDTKNPKTAKKAAPTKEDPKKEEAKKPKASLRKVKRNPKKVEPMKAKPSPKKVEVKKTKASPKKDKVKKTDRPCRNHRKGGSISIFLKLFVGFIFRRQCQWFFSWMNLYTPHFH